MEKVELILFFPAMRRRTPAGSLVDFIDGEPPEYFLAGDKFHNETSGRRRRTQRHNIAVMTTFSGEIEMKIGCQFIFDRQLIA